MDVPHKKRGRPRLRDEAEFRVEQVEQVEPPQSAMPRPAPSRITGGERAYGTTRHGRTDSLRTLRSHASEMSIVPSLTQGTVTTTIPTAAPQSGPHYPSHPVIPTAFLDLDLAIMKTNIAFQQLFTTFQNLVGRRLTDIARALHEREDFQTVRNGLRAEREAKDPAFLPPILQAGNDPLPDLVDQEIDQATQGFDDRTHFWTYNLSLTGEQALPTRVRLAKSSIFFVVITLPPLPQAEQYLASVQRPATVMSGPPVASPFQMPLVMDPTAVGPRRSLPQSAPPSPFYTYPSISQGPSAVPTSSRTYPPPQAPLPYQQQQQMSPQQFPLFTSPPAPAPVQPAAEASGSAALTTDPFTPRFTARRLSQPVPAGAQLPPLAGTTIARGGIMQSPRQQIQQQPPLQQSLVRQHTSSEEEEAEAARSPRKRRRTGMEIDHVLQR